MIVCAIIQARLSSKRFPGKVLADLNGRPILAHVIERARKIEGVDHVVVAMPEDDYPAIPNALLPFAGGYSYGMGPRDDVLARFHLVAKILNPDVIVRLTADNPLLDPQLSSLVLRWYMANREHIDYVSNAYPPSFPDGLDTEVFSRRALDLAHRHAATAYDREHVTAWMRNNLAISTVQHREDYSHLRWTVDRPADLEHVRAVHAATFPEMNWEHVVRAYYPDAVKHEVLSVMST